MWLQQSKQAQLMEGAEARGESFLGPEGHISWVHPPLSNPTNIGDLNNASDPYLSVLPYHGGADGYLDATLSILVGYFLAQYLCLGGGGRGEGRENGESTGGEENYKTHAKTGSIPSNPLCFLLCPLPLPTNNGPLINFRLSVILC